MKILIRIHIVALALLTLPLFGFSNEPEAGIDLSLNGKWQMGIDRKYGSTVVVPSIAQDPARMLTGKLWYKKQVKLPAGTWEYATLELKGARFQPEIFVDGVSLGKMNGGMAPVFKTLAGRNIKPGGSIELEIALSSLKDVSSTDASYIPPADQWRSNISSGIWDDVVLHLHGPMRIKKVIPFVDHAAQLVSFKFALEKIATAAHVGKARLQIFDDLGKKLFSLEKPISGLQDSIQLSYRNKLKEWSPEHPTVYHLSLTIFDRQNKILDEARMPFGLKVFSVLNKQFYLNGQPEKLRGGTVVWHRWVRSREGQELGYDTAWFRVNIVQRLKDHGANYLRFHLGKPPERFLDLCDRYGLIVQYEWSFFHGMPATAESLWEQYQPWLDLAVRHPSVSLIHPYNETEGDQLKTVWDVLSPLLLQYPPLVLEDRDVIHVHKYWWSLFENLGLYFDSAQQFDKAIMVDEFGGNYLDENGDLGGYKALKESYMRFLGRNHTVDERLAFHAMTAAKVAEYWRRIDAAGFAPFCILGSWEDGNNWFLGPLKEGHPKPVWDALTAAYSPQSVSLDLWDRNFTPNSSMEVPLCFFNDAAGAVDMQVELALSDESNHTVFDTLIHAVVLPFSKIRASYRIQLPGQKGNFDVHARLLNRPADIRADVVSSWPIHIFQTASGVAVQNASVAVPEGEPELKAFLTQQKIGLTSILDPSARVIITSMASWKRVGAGDQVFLHELETAIDRGCSIVMLDAGERNLGQGYPSVRGDLGPLQGVARITNPAITSYSLFKGVKAIFTEAAEPESHLHADRADSQLWRDIPRDYTWLWNGLRGGLVAPASEMSFSGLSAVALLAQWQARGADTDAMVHGPYYAYELQGFYAFSAQANDAEIQKKLKQKLAFLVEDAPALANAINPLSPIAITDLTAECKNAMGGQALKFTSLANCGKNLTRTPVALIDFGAGKGKLLISQLLTAGRLAPGFGEPGFYGIRYDEVAAQMVLNMINTVIE